MQEQEQEQGQAGTGHVRWVEAVGLGAACASNGSRVCRWFSPSVRRYATGDGESGWWVTGGAVCRWEGARRWGGGDQRLAAASMAPTALKALEFVISMEMGYFHSMNLAQPVQQPRSALCCVV